MGRRGVYLGKGLVLTAAHVVTPVARTKPSVRIAGMDLPATAIREGNFERVDLTLLSIDEQKLPIYLQMRRMPLCDNEPWPGEPVIVAIPEGTARSHIMLPSLLPAGYQKRFSTVIRDVVTTGNSGSGVFDAGQKCLLGIIRAHWAVFALVDRNSVDQHRLLWTPGGPVLAFLYRVPSERINGHRQLLD